MRFEYDASGAWLVNPGELAERLGIATRHLASQMRRGLVLSTIERGTGEDKGRSRVTVRSDSPAWQGVFDSSGELFTECEL